ncbi:coiled-coil domain-containing protein 148-like isoform X1 [Siniperca chuatsi]|uniref:coiled-coil domain-containing protein 148-like isoform X1 n=2 Tax=Siniperca chuatsi TaxID=119488 RepID=UPI001CE1E8A5|nr:coiled-coil domain-containing protein 148-like isoform X1 [Siniperca chuatsi]XP_044072472.1 coiled-coil domain-containing protein 148-like isoform X1 [Siniperca chuatsi]XP_044072473.1 coiled-coil domain-containing protein 148-like isoform X1 [Siniperca chuatsi]XP_044072474.1 coiled-coil domain-containing protein 148-like isoform X1 [Siniperca chuatsi]XP_044072475.1 coiled-coil domain-containing protein 148-like isoform X1 [Siniperca chuatsi]XP_044072476.1 coiled-coil domain-containing prote
MSGRDLHTFVTNYKAEDVEKLTLRMKNGLGSSKYKPAEYKRLQAIVDAKRLECDLTGQKVQKTRCAAKATKESSILRQHRQVWSRECPRLQKTEEQAENDIHDFLEQIRPNGRTDTAIFSLQDYGQLLEREREAFRIATVEPVHQLKDDLCFRLGEVQHRQLTAHRSNWEQVIQQITFVKDQQDDINANLHAEYLALEEEIIGLGLEKYHISTSDSPVNIENIPEEVLDLDCPYPELKDSLIQAFHSLSERYQSRLQSLQEQLQRTNRFCGWCADDHQRFQFTLSQYTHDIPNHRALYMDMLQRLFPEKTRQELMEHERVWDWQRFTQAQLRVVTQQWQRDQDELLARALVTLQEARHVHQEELELHRDRQHQQDICSHLREKLQQWRAQQEEVAKLEAAIAARQQEEEEARVKKEQEKETAIRSKQKEKVRQFYLKQQKRREVLGQRDQERLANLRSVMEEQARRDKERVQFRADMLQRRREEREVRELERQREEEEKRNRLEVLRNQVGVVAEADPERMMADTDAWRSRHLNVKEFELQRPLYSINTYTDTQIVSDPRVRVEQALREAGLHHSQYAKEVLSVIKPPKPPRRDTKSILKF